MTNDEGRLRFLRRRVEAPRRRFRRGVYLLPSLLTMGNMFCGYASIVYAMRAAGSNPPRSEDFERAALFIGFGFVLDILDGRVARLTGATSDFGLQFDSLADVVSFGLAPAVLSLEWGLQPLHRLGWAVGFLFVAAAAMRLARFNIQTAAGGDKRYFVGMPSPSAAAVPAATVYAYPPGVHDDYRSALLVLLMVLVPAVLMVSTIRFRSFKTIDLQSRRPYTQLLVIALGIAAVATHPRFVLVAMAYAYLVSAFLGMAITRFRHRGGRATPETPPGAADAGQPRDSAAG